MTRPTDTNQPMTAAPPSPPHEAHLSGHVHGEGAVEILTDHRYKCGSDRGVTPRWEECVCGERFTSTAAIPAWRALASHQAAALTAAGLLATEQDWAVVHPHPDHPDLAEDPTTWREPATVFSIDRYARAGYTVVSRGVTAWREQA